MNVLEPKIPEPDDQMIGPAGERVHRARLVQQVKYEKSSVINHCFKFFTSRLEKQYSIVSIDQKSGHAIRN